MPLAAIRNKCAADVGIDLSDATQLALLDRKINEAAKELYESDDLVGCLREQIFQIDPADEQITLPWYVYQVRGVRQDERRTKIERNDMRPRYSTKDWGPEHRWRWRFKGYTPLAMQPTNYAPFIVSIPVAETVAFNVIITGCTTTASRVADQLTFAVGDISKTATKQFQPGQLPECVESIKKDRWTQQDVTIKDADGNAIAVIPNSELESRNMLVHVSDFQGMTVADVFCVEVLYKLRFSPMYLDYDEFFCRGYDDAIYFKFLERWWSIREGKAQDALLAHEKVKELVTQIARDSELGTELKVDVGRGRSPFENPYDNRLDEYRHRQRFWRWWQCR
jgi:hypothetical protein